MFCEQSLYLAVVVLIDNNPKPNMLELSLDLVIHGSIVSSLCFESAIALFTFIYSYCLD